MRSLSLLEYTSAGAAAGALFTGLGATVLHPAAPDLFDRRGAAVSGLLGGAATHAVIGIVSAFDPAPHFGDRLRGLGASLPLAAATSGIIGGAILAAGGYHDNPSPSAMVISGLMGGAIITVAAGMATCAAVLTCTHRPRWTALASGDLGEGAVLETPPRHEHAPPVHYERGESSGDGHRSLAERLLPFQRSGEKA